ncbi:MAG: hypothetical protein GF331_13800 [Chitinivibrionales bacterium]|nr:hypothetical protein [Chitinivibrionales bacterium]
MTIDNEHSVPDSTGRSFKATAYTSPTDTSGMYYELLFLIEGVWGDSVAGWDDAVAYVSAAEPPASAAQLADPGRFVKTLTMQGWFTVAGWSDCSFDWRSAGRTFIDGQYWTTGTSGIRSRLAERLYGRFD